LLDRKGPSVDVEAGEVPIDSLPPEPGISADEDVPF
jgi:hypothetical protein